MSRWLKDSPNLDHLRIRLGGDDQDTREVFSQLARGGVQQVDRITFKLSEAGAVSDMGYFEANIRRSRRGTMINELSIVINKDDFVGGDERSMEPIIHHEVSELFHLASGRELPSDFDRESTTSSMECHRKALVDEYEYAIKKGQGREHLEFVLRKADTIDDYDARVATRRENMDAYRKARNRVQRAENGKR